MLGPVEVDEATEATEPEAVLGGATCPLNRLFGGAAGEWVNEASE